jgi:hypothetical protein
MFHNVDEEEKNLFVRIFLMFHNVDEEEKNLFLDERSMGCGNELDDFQIAELMKRINQQNALCCLLLCILK